MRTSTLVAIIAIASPANGGTFVEYDDKLAWQEAAGRWATITFSDYPQETTITDQYQELGIVFTDADDDIYFTPSFLEDNWGLRGSESFEKRDTISIQFASATYWLAADYPGALQIEFYSLGELVHMTEMYGGGTGNFLGVVSSIAFDQAVIFDPFGSTFIDDLHFGGVPAPGALPLLGAPLLRSPRRRS